MHIDHAVIADLPRIMEIYACARRFMAENGNPRQWGPTNWPPESLIRSDIEVGNLYVCVKDEEDVVADAGEDVQKAPGGEIVGLLRPAHRGEGPEGGGKPGVQDVLVAVYIFAVALFTLAGVLAGDGDMAAVVAVPGGDLVAPPELA